MSGKTKSVGSPLRILQPLRRRRPTGFVDTHAGMDQTALLAAAVWWVCDATLLRPVARRVFGDGEPCTRSLAHPPCSTHPLHSSLAIGRVDGRIPTVARCPWNLNAARRVPRHVPGICARRTGATATLGRAAPTPAHTPMDPTRTNGAVSQAWLMELFLLVFACGLLQDCVRFPTTMGTLLLAHHAACLVGMVVARFAPGAEWSSVFPWFFGGCTALEFGSGFNNVFWLRWLPPRLSELLYLFTMTVSNLVAVACVCAWVRTAKLEKWHSGPGPWSGRLGAIHAARHVRTLLHTRWSRPCRPWRCEPSPSSPSPCSSTTGRRRR